ncbi:MAG: alpha/beta hydrolase [Candidatus Tectimicrobiota bacterium]
MSPGLVRSIGGYAGSQLPHPQRQLDASLGVLGYQVEGLELPENTAPQLEACVAFLHTQLRGLRNGMLITHSLASRVFFLLVEQLRSSGQLRGPLLDTAVLLAPANGRYIADWVPEVAAFFCQQLWVPDLSGVARRLLLAAADDDPYWEEAETDLSAFRQQAGVEVLVLPGQGHLNDPEVSGDLPQVRAWILAGQAG